MGTYIIVAGLLVIVFFAVRSSLKHIKGEGGCCGGSSDVKLDKKKLDGAKIAEKVVYIEGMHCDNCKNSVERRINDIEGAVAMVQLKKKRALVSSDREIEDELLVEAVQKAGFEVVRIERKEV